MTPTPEQLAALVTPGTPAVLGPYAERSPTHALRKVWVVLLVGASGDQAEQRFDLYDVAQKFASGRRVRLVAKPTTLAHALDAWLHEKACAKAWSPKTWRRTVSDVQDFCDPADTPLAAVDKHFLLDWVARMGERLSLASCKSHYGSVSEFLAWCQAEDLLASNPTACIDPKRHLPWSTKRGRREVGRGKQQLTEGEAIAYLKQARLFSSAEERVAVVLPLLLGLASGEVLHLRARDIDLKGRSIHIRNDGGHPDQWRTKTESRAAVVDVDDRDLLRDLERLVAEREGKQYLFPSNRRPGWPCAEDWLWHRVRQCCTEAEVTVVCPHGLRGSYSTLLQLLARKRAPDIAKLLRHGDAGQTARRHYMAAPEGRPSLRMDRGEQEAAA